MTVFVCIDDTMGMAFNGRRQSRDSAVVEDILATCGGVPQMDARSEKLFGQGGKVEGAYFMEFSYEEARLAAAETLVVYRWNRAYPADVKFTVPQGFSLKESRDFAGSSHEKITREEYIREK